MMRAGWLEAMALVALVALSGCVSSTGDGAEAGALSLTGSGGVGGLAGSAATPGFVLDPELLTKPVYGMLPKLTDYVVSDVEGIDLYIESYLPDGPGPWPTILINSPYFDHGINGNIDTMLLFRQYFVPRGYAVAAADVRGTGYSEGCMDMMGAKEQADTASLVEWIAAQDWSNGRVGMYGVSYVGTTPHEALIMAPPSLDTVVTVAGVTNQWRNTYQNGVPYSFRFYPITYEALEGAPPPGDVQRGPAWAENTAAAACEQEEALMAMSPGTYEKGVYSAYWHERNFTQHVADVKASIFYNQGFTDRAVNPMEAVHWFNDLDVPKKAFFGQWPHATPQRDDWQNTLNAWFDYWLMDIDNGIMATATVEVVSNQDTVRADSTWPPVDADTVRFYLSPGVLTQERPAAAAETYLADMGRNPYEGQAPHELTTPTELEFISDPVTQAFTITGHATMNLEASVDAENTYFLLDLYDVAPDGTWQRLTEGWFNAHLHDGFDHSSPLVAGQRTSFDFKFEPREYVFAEGHRIGLRIHGHDSRVMPVDELVTQNTVHYGGDAPSFVDIPFVSDPEFYDLETVAALAVPPDDAS